MRKLTRFGLLHQKSGKLLGAKLSSNRDGDFCVDTQHILEQVEDNDSSVWLVERDWHAEWVRHNPTEWYNAGYDTPTHSFQADDLEVVSVGMEIEKIEIAIPTADKLFSRKYAKEQAHLEYIKSQGYVVGRKYSLYDLMQDRGEFF